MPNETTVPNADPTTVVPSTSTEPIIDPPADPDSGDTSRIKKDMLKYKDENSQLKKQLDDIKLQSHKAKEDWKTVAEHHENKAKEFETKFTGLQSALVAEKKVSALTIEAQKQGINPASLPDLEMLDFEEVQVETTSQGKILVTGQDRAIAKLKLTRPHWFQTTVPSVNPQSPNTNRIPTGAVTLADVNAAEAQYKKTKSESDKKAYGDIIQKFKAQK